MKDNNEHKARRGEKFQIPAGTWNNVLDATKDYKRNKYNPENAVNAGVPTSLTQSNLEILIRNESDYDLATSYKILRLTDIVCDTDHIQQSNRYIFEGETPTFATNKFAVVQQPLVIGDMGKAIISGLAFTRVHMVDLAHEYANPTPSVDGWLTSSTTGQARILYFTATGDAGEAAADIYFAVVNIGDGKGANGDTVNRIVTLIESNVIEGEQGPPGRRGPQGVQGLQGKRGYTIPGEDGIDGENIVILQKQSTGVYGYGTNTGANWSLTTTPTQVATVTLPSSGIYELTICGTCEGQITATAPGHLFGDLYNVTDSAYVVPDGTGGASVTFLPLLSVSTTAAPQTFGTFCFVYRVTVNGAKQIDFRAWKSGASTWANAQIYGSGTPGLQILYRKL